MNQIGLLPRLFVSLTFLLLVPAVSSQTDNARIQGTVSNTTGTAIPAAAITVTNLKTGALSKTRTDGTGNFTVSALSVGDYKISVQAAGFQNQEQNFSLTDSQIKTINFKLPAVRPPRRSRPRAPAPTANPPAPPQVRSSSDINPLSPTTPQEMMT